MRLKATSASNATNAFHNARQARDFNILKDS